MVKTIIIGLIITIVGLFALSAVHRYTTKIDPSSSLNGYSTTLVESSNIAKVAISGEVSHAGTYSIAMTDTLGNLITMAGGVTDKADPKSYNASLVISTHVSFYIPPVSETPSVCVDTAITKVNINTAESEALVNIGFSTTQAGNLITYRNENGAFQALEDIEKVKGIGEATFTRVKNKITLS
jgi:competence protein ComEA